ncbi:5039_t:CDS:2 [Gigaspora rosea]|nr:5039_t:CDS:2 [Gigaspora rosea]
MTGTLALPGTSALCHAYANRHKNARHYYGTMDTKCQHYSYQVSDKMGTKCQTLWALSSQHYYRHYGH